MSKVMTKTIASHPSRAIALPKTIFNHQPGEFRENFNRVPFRVSHNLADHPLFSLPRLMELAEKLKTRNDRVAFYTDSPRIDQGWKRSRHQEATLAEAFSHIEETNSWVLLKAIQEESEYQALLDQCLVELGELTGVDLHCKVTWADADVFIASPKGITPYHIDHETNFLLQIHGEKEVNLFNPDDRTILTEPEIEQYYMGDFNGAKYREEIQEKAQVFKIASGQGVHHPVRAPHWVRNGNSYSVSLALLFFMREFDLQARVYQANHYIRMLKMIPTPPGKSAMKDKAKIFFLGNMGLKPKSKSDVIRLGLKKFKAPVRLGQWIAKQFTH
jgi:hypothetical protein